MKRFVIAGALGLAASIGALASVSGAAAPTRPFPEGVQIAPYKNPSLMLVNAEICASAVPSALMV